MSNVIQLFSDEEETMSEHDIQLFIDELDALDHKITNTTSKNEHAVTLSYDLMKTILTDCNLIHALYGELILPSDCKCLLPAVLRLLNTRTDLDKSELQTLLTALQDSVVHKKGLYWWWDSHE